MKTTEVLSKDPITEPDEHKASPAVANETLASIQFLELIAQQPFFQGLSVHHLELLADFAMETRFKPGQWIFRQGAPANHFYLIVEGKVSIESEVKERGMSPIRTLGPGDDIGWAWLFAPYQMHFSAWAIDPTHVIFFDGNSLREQSEVNQEFGYRLMKRIAEVVVQNLNVTQQRLSATPTRENVSTS
jgi:CRP/FNR family cyclic AMP-dependent transcriptional regulator